MTDYFDEELLTAQEVGRMLRLKPSTIYEASASGRLRSGSGARWPGHFCWKACSALRRSASAG